MRNLRKLSQAVPVPRLMSELELDVMSSCLVRQGIGSLQANLQYSEARIKGTYKEVFLQQQGYCLNTMMVHKGHNWEYQHYRGDICLYFTHWQCLYPT